MVHNFTTKFLEKPNKQHTTRNKQVKYLKWYTERGFVILLQKYICIVYILKEMGPYFLHQYLGNKKVNTFLIYMHLIWKFVSSGSRKEVKILDWKRQVTVCFLYYILENSSSGFVSKCFIKITEKINENYCNLK